MADRLNGYRILILETREEAQFWLEAMTQVRAGAELPQLALYMARQPYDRPLARSEIVSGAQFIEWFAEEARRAYGETTAAGTRKP